MGLVFDVALVIVIVAGIAGVVVIIGKILAPFEETHFERARDAWKSLSGSTNLELRGGEPAAKTVKWLPRMRNPTYLEGTVRGHVTTINDYSVGSLPTHRNYTQLTVMVQNSRDLTLAILPGDRLHWGKVSFDAEDVQIGDPELDNVLMVQTNSEGFARAVFSPEFNALVKEELSLGGFVYSLSLKHQQIHYREVALISDMGVQERFPRMMRIALVLADTTDSF